MIDVLCATKGERRPIGLENLPFKYTYFEDTGPHWGEASNRLLDIAAERGNDALFMDDDIEILPSTMDGFLRYYADADILGFSLLGPCGDRGFWIQSAGTMLCPQEGNEQAIQLTGLDVHPAALTMPVYLAHTGTCLCLIKNSVLRAGIRFPVWPGLHYEDAILCYEAWMKGFRCLRVPSVGIHHCAPNGAGITKGNDPEFAERRKVNEALYIAWCEENGVGEALAAGKIPLGYMPVWEWGMK